MAISQKKVEFIPKVVDDHNLVSWTARCLKLTYLCCLNENTLNSLKALEKLKKETKVYFETNLGNYRIF